MDDAPFMRRFQSCRDLAAEAERFLYRNAAFPGTLREALPELFPAPELRNIKPFPVKVKAQP